MSGKCARNEEEKAICFARHIERAKNDFKLLTCLLKLQLLKLKESLES